MKATLELSEGTQFSLPQNTSIVEHRQKIIIIDSNSANWIVLQNSIELEIYNQLKEHTVGEIFPLFPESSLLNVITQIAAKGFTSTHLRTNQEVPHEPGLCLYLTTACNMRCKHCYMYAGSPQGNELTTNEVFAFLDSFAQAGGKKITLTGGEATLRKDFADIVEYAGKLKLVTTVLTNGLLWNKKLIHALKPYIGEVQVSIDGHDEASYNAMRRYGYKKAIKCVEQLLEHGYKTTVAITPIAENLENERSSYVAFAKDLLNKWKDFPFQIKFSHEILTGREISPSETQNKHYRAIIESIVNEIYPNDKIKTFALNRKHQSIFKNCGFGEITVFSNGDIYYCNRVYELKKQGNIRTCNFTDIIENARAAQEAACVDNLVPCNSCDIKYICGGGCRIKHFPELAQCTEFAQNHQYSRTCERSTKNEFYDLMIESNELLYGIYEQC